MQLRKFYLFKASPKHSKIKELQIKHYFKIEELTKYLEDNSRIYEVLNYYPIRAKEEPIEDFSVEEIKQLLLEVGFVEESKTKLVFYKPIKAVELVPSKDKLNPQVDQLSKLGLKRAIGLRNSATDENPKEELIKFVVVSAINVPADASSIYDAIDNPVNISHPFSHYDEEYRAYFEEPVHEIEQCNYRQNQNESLGLAVFLQALIQRQPRGNYYKTYLHNLHKEPTLLAGVSEDLLFSDSRRTHYVGSWRDRIFNTCVCFDRLDGLAEEALEDGGLPVYLAQHRENINNIFSISGGERKVVVGDKDAFAKEQVTTELINYQTESFNETILAKKGQRVFVVLTGTCRKSDVYIATKSSTGNSLADEMLGSKQGQSTQVRIIPKELDVWVVEDPAKVFQTHEMLFSFHPGLFFDKINDAFTKQYTKTVEKTVLSSKHLAALKEVPNNSSNENV